MEKQIQDILDNMWAVQFNVGGEILKSVHILILCLPFGGCLEGVVKEHKDENSIIKVDCN